LVKLKSSRLITGFVTRLTRRVPLVEQELLSLPDHLSSPPDFIGVRVTRSLVLCVCFVDRCLPFCTFSFDHCVVCSSIYRYGFGLPILTIVLSVLRYTGTDSDYPFWPLCCLFFDIPVRILITHFDHCVVCSSIYRYGFWLPPFCIFKLFFLSYSILHLAINWSLSRSVVYLRGLFFVGLLSSWIHIAEGISTDVKQQSVFLSKYCLPL
jgi:hypothetical protein